MGTKCSKVQKDERHQGVYRTVSKSMWLRKEIHCGRVREELGTLKHLNTEWMFCSIICTFYFMNLLKFKSSNMVMFAH